MRTFSAPFVVALALLSACGKDDARTFGDPSAVVSPKLQPFASCDDLRDALVDSFVEQIVSSRYGYGYGRDLGAEEDAAGDDGSGGDGPDDYSTTNVQEEGVDEPDIVKTDGDYVYVVQQWSPELTIVDAWPPESAAVVGRIELDGYPYSAFLHGDTMAVFSYVYGDGGGREDGGWGTAETPLRGGYGTRISLIDVTDRANPTLTRDIDVEGWLASARLIDGDAYVVMNNWLEMPQELWDLAWGEEDIGLPEPDWDATEAEQALIRAEARRVLYPHVEEAVAAMDLDDLLPFWFAGQDGAWDDGQRLVECTDVYHPDGVAQPGLLSVLHLDLDAPTTTTPSATGLFANGWTVYASQESLYVSQTSWYWSWGYEDDALTTHLHRFALGGDATVYASSGEVPGWQWSQFALDEQDGYLRVATSSQDWWWGTDTEQEGSGVYVLQEQGDTLGVIGSVDKIAPGESIYAVRFVDDMAYLVTFLQVDPLFAIDLSVPTAPVVVGELHIPGFSSYIHPVEEGYLLTVGMAGEDDGTITGFAVKLFDVRDPTTPTLVGEALAESDDWSWSESLWDHHAFTFHNGVLAVPIYTYDYDGTDWTGFSGLWALQVDTSTGLTDLGRVDHGDMVASSDCVYDDYYGYEDSGEPCASDWWYASMRRSVVMEDKLYSVSDYGIKVSELYTPSTTVATVPFWPLE